MSEHKRNIKKVKRCEVPFKLVDASHFGLSWGLVHGQA
jgi:hypothetical protein